MSMHRYSENALISSETMSSVTIAQIAGKQHKDVLEAIRKMEPAWEKVAGRKFPLSEYKDTTGRKLPMYELTKTECLYVAAKFNDEARAKLVLRWEALEKENLKKVEKKSIPVTTLYTENQIFLTKLGEGTIKGYYTNGKPYYSLVGVLKHLGYSFSGNGSYAEKYKGSIKVNDGSRVVWFVNIDYVEELIRHTTIKITNERLSSLYRDLFNIEIKQECKKVSSYGFTDKQMLNLITKVNQVNKYELRCQILNLLLEGTM